MLVMVAALMAVFGGLQSATAGGDQIVLVFNVGEKLDMDNQSYTTILLDKNYDPKIYGPVVSLKNGKYVVNKRGVLMSAPDTAPDVTYVDIKLETTPSGYIWVIPAPGVKVCAYIGMIINGKYVELRKVTF